jgi:rSAM/selenodomain-associated transferase 1
METCAVGVMARAPVAGEAKTRLIPALGPARAAALHQRLARAAIAAAVAARVGPVTLWAHPSPEHRLFRRCRDRYGVALAPQRGADLGARMLNAIEQGLQRCSAALVIGTDCPELGPPTLRAAARALAEGADAVLLPVEDGGYGLIGMRRADPAVFEDIAWGGATVLAATRERMDALRWQVALLPETWDLDRPADLARLASFRRRARAAPRSP